MIIKLILFLLVVYLLFKFAVYGFKKWLTNSLLKATKKNQPLELVCCEQCGEYIDEHLSLTRRDSNGVAHRYCSSKCAK
ncbi:MAG: hypothetical protein ACI86H_000528 [bacterium]|jgi:hypothetical protein